MEQITKSLLLSLLKPIKCDAHKGCSGTLSAILGSTNYRGAASLAIGAALRTGCGITRLISIEKVISAVAANHPCCTFIPVSESPVGTVGDETPSVINAAGSSSTAFLIGCGIGQSPQSCAALSAVLSCDKPTVIDADALNLLSHFPELWEIPRKSDIIITPHVGEFSRLSGLSADEIKSAPAKYASQFSERHSCITVLKDNCITVSTKNGDIYESTLGSPGLAKGGSGDVLAGLISGFAAQSYTAADAAVIGCAVHGLSSQLCATENGIRSMLPLDLEKYIAELIASLGY